jgi:hypothetical protein
MQNGSALAILDDRFKEKTDELLDNIFSNDLEMRSVVSIASPRHCNDREVRILITTTDRDLYARTFCRIMDWLAQGNSPKIDSLMLF